MKEKRRKLAFRVEQGPCGLIVMPIDRETGEPLADVRAAEVVSKCDDVTVMKLEVLVFHEEDLKA